MLNGRRFELTDLGGELVEVAVGLLEQLLAVQLGSHCVLQQLRRRQFPILYGTVEIVGEIDLDSWRAPTMRLLGRVHATQRP